MPSQRETPETLQREIAETRERMSRTVAKVEERVSSAAEGVKRSVDLGALVREYPWAALAAAVLAGAALSATRADAKAAGATARAAKRAADAAADRAAHAKDVVANRLGHDDDVRARRAPSRRRGMFSRAKAAVANAARGQAEQLTAELGRAADELAGSLGAEDRARGDGHRPAAGTV